MNKRNYCVLCRRNKLVRVLSLILALSIIVPMTGCGGKKEDIPQPTETSAPISTPAPAVVETEEVSSLPETPPVSESNNDQPDAVEPTETPAPTVDPAAQAQAEAEERARAEE